MAKRKRTIDQRRWPRFLGFCFLLCVALATWYWWNSQYFAPKLADFPEQGFVVDQTHRRVGFETARVLGASFVYVNATAGSSSQDQQFGANLNRALEARLLVGAVHRFDPCTAADPQSANFLTMVPREEALLPPAIALQWTADICDKPVTDAALESELLTLINQIEMHSGKPVILKISDRFEDRYSLADRLDRDLWLIRDGFVPRYAERPWLLWTANSGRRSEISDKPVEWVVVQP